MNDKSIESRIAELENRVARLESDSVGPTSSKSAITKKLSIKEFLLSKSVDNDVKRTVAIAYYLEKFEGMTSFNTDDLKKCYQLAKHPLPGNLNDKVNMGIKGAFLMESEEKKDSKKAWMLTASGEKAVEDNFVLPK